MSTSTKANTKCPVALTENNTCKVCFDQEAKHPLACCHSFCSDCISGICKRASTSRKLSRSKYLLNCPICRTESEFDLDWLSTPPAPKRCKTTKAPAPKRTKTTKARVPNANQHRAPTELVESNSDQFTRMLEFDPFADLTPSFSTFAPSFSTFSRGLPSFESIARSSRSFSRVRGYTADSNNNWSVFDITFE